MSTNTSSVTTTTTTVGVNPIASTRTLSAKAAVSASIAVGNVAQSGDSMEVINNYLKGRPIIVHGGQTFTCYNLSDRAIYEEAGVDCNNIKELSLLRGGIKLTQPAQVVHFMFASLLISGNLFF